MAFSDQLWNHISDIYQSILELPFNKELANGTLEQSTFAFYMKQDSLYLADFSRALAIAGVKHSDSEILKEFLGFAEEAIVVERALHEGFLKQYNTYVNVDKAPGCFMYTNFLLATAWQEEFPVICAALLPCFWIYREVGMHIHKHAAANNPYQSWIDNYAGDDFNNSVNRAITITNQAAEQSTDAIRKKMTSAFEYSARLEWIFWDSAYRMEQWKP